MLWLHLVFVGVLSFLALRSAAQNYRSVNLGGWLVVEGWMTPSLFDGVQDRDLMDGAQIQLKSLNLGTFVVAQDGGGNNLAVTSASASGWETFRIWRVQDGTYQLRVFNKNFVQALNAGGGIVNAVATIPRQWETFQIIRNPSDKNQVHIQAYNGMYIQAQSQDQVTADFQGEPGWNDGNAATFEMTIVTDTNFGIGGEYQLTNGLGPDQASQVMNDHWNNFINESDFEFLSSKGINAVRIPVGWWIASDPNPPAPFVGGSLNALDNAFTWAENHNIVVIVDLHAVPGSQNGDDHSGTRDGYLQWPFSADNITTSITVIDFLASRYASHPALLGFELLNEPRAITDPSDANFPGVPLDTLTAYYKSGYDTVRNHSSSAYVIMCNRIGPAYDQELFDMNNGLTNTVVDVHYYNLYDDSTFGSMSAQQNIDFVNNNRAQALQSLTSANGPLIYVGEWTNEWEVQNASMSDYQGFGQAQLQVYGTSTFGWGYWGLKNDNFEHWSFQWMVESNYLQCCSN